MGKQLGSNDKPVHMSSKKNKGRVYAPSWHCGKGAAPRINTQSQQYRDNWDLIFGKKDKEVKTKSKD